MVADMELFFRFVQKEALFSIQILFVVDWNRFLDSLDINMRVWLESSPVQFLDSKLVLRQCPAITRKEILKVSFTKPVRQDSNSK